ncbi:MAG: radical SAM protein, partial [Planctomycetota bacterium]
LLPIPLQSGSDSVLRRMKRGYTLDLYRRRIDLLREHMPDLELVSDWIVGFPGETEADFSLSLEALEEFQFLHSYVFQYSPRPGTAAMALADDVPPAVKRARNHRLLDAQRELAPRRTRTMVGRTSRLLLDAPLEDTPGFLRGRIHNGHHAILEAGRDAQPGKSLDVELTGWNGRELIARELAAAAAH